MISQNADANQEATSLPAVRVDIPPRRLIQSLATLKTVEKQFGIKIDNDARSLSFLEWQLDIDRAQKIKAAQNLSDDQFIELLEKFRERNKIIWGEYSSTKCSAE